MNNLAMYNKYAQPPDNALKAFNNGSFSGTDINPMWRIKVLTEEYGECGFGWYVEPVRSWTEQSEKTVMVDQKEKTVVEISVFYEVALYVKRGEAWSKPIYGVGGNTYAEFIKKRGSVVVSDEAYKMAYTDAIGIACKALGIGANIWWKSNDSKYTKNNYEDPVPAIICSSCQKPIPAETLINGKRYNAASVAKASEKSYGVKMCYACKLKADQSDSPAGDYDARAEQEVVEGSRGAIAS